MKTSTDRERIVAGKESNSESSHSHSQQSGNPVCIESIKENTRFGFRY